MATYKEIKGVTLQALDDDPVLNVGSWSSGGDMNQARSAMLGGGSRTSNIQAGGTHPGTSPTYNDECEEYNGSAWSEIAEMNQDRAFGGYTNPPAADSALTEEWTASLSNFTITSS